MKNLVTMMCILLINFTNVFGDSIELLEKQLEEAASWEEEVDIYLSIIDVIVWTEGSYKKGKEYQDKIIEICQNHDCSEQESIARAYLSEIEINKGDFSTIEEWLLPAIKEQSTFSRKTVFLFHELIGYHFLVQGNSSEALPHLKAAQSFLEKDDPKSRRLGKVYYYLGFAHNIDGTNGMSIDFLRKAVDHFSMLEDSSMLLEAKSGLSTLLATDGKYAEAINLLLESIKLAESSQVEEIRKFQLYDALIDIYIRNGNYDKAEKSHYEIMPQLYALNIPIAQKANDLWSFNMSYAKLMGRMNRFSEGLQHVDSAYVYAGYLGEFTIRITDLRKAGLLVKLKNYEIAEIHLTTLLEDMKPFGDVDAFHAVMVGLFSTIYSNSTLQPSLQLQKELLPIVDRIITKNKEDYNLDVLDAEQLSAVLGIYNSDMNRSLHSFSRVVQIKDTLQNIEQAKITNELLVQYETNEKESLIQIQKLELSQKTVERNAFIGISLASAFSLVFLFLFYFQKKKYAKHLEQEVNKRTAELQQANADLNESKDELERYHYIASHDLKEPLRNVVSFVDYIKKKKVVENKEALVYFGYIQKGAYQMNKIVQDLADLSNLQDLEIQMKNININHLIDEIKTEVKLNLGSQMASIETKNFPANIISDKSALYLVFKNLIENGLKFNENEFPFVNIEYHDLEESHLFEVIDNGIGIDSEYHDKVFELFKRLNNRSQYGGSGVGLAICKKLINKIHGEISIRSNLYNGSTFVIEIPKNPEINKIQTGQKKVLTTS